MLMIFKYEMPLIDHATIDMPEGAKVLGVAVQRDNPVLYALVDPHKPPHPKRFRVAGTGHPVADDFVGRFIGTVNLRDGGLMFHVFELDFTP